MWSIERLKLFAAVAVCISLMNIVADVALAGMHAGIDWYYGVAYFLAMLGVFRVMFPGIGIPERYTELPPRQPRSGDRRSVHQTSDKLDPLAGHARTGHHDVEARSLAPLTRVYIDVRVVPERADRVQ